MSSHPVNYQVQLSNENPISPNISGFEDQQDFLNFKLPPAIEQMVQGTIVPHGPRGQSMPILRQNYPQPSAAPDASWPQQTSQPPTTLPNNPQYASSLYTQANVGTLPQAYNAAGQPLPYSGLDITAGWAPAPGHGSHPSQLSSSVNQGNAVHRHPGPNPRAAPAAQLMQRPLRNHPQQATQLSLARDVNYRVRKSAQPKEKTPKFDSGPLSFLLVLEDSEDCISDLRKIAKNVTAVACENASYTADGVPKVSLNDLYDFILREAKAVPLHPTRNDSVPPDNRERLTPCSRTSVSESILSKQHIAQQYRGYQKEFRLKIPEEEQKYKCTVGCPWSHGTKANWERHEKSHYPQEIWLCCHKDCLEKDSKTRVSFRKDLARRHHEDHHKARPTDRELEKLRIKVSESLFPRHCVFVGCSETFSTFDERLMHVEQHLRDLHTLDRASIQKHYLPGEPVNQEPTDSPDLADYMVKEEGMHGEDQGPGPSNQGEQEDDDERDAEGDSDEEDDDDDDDDDDEDNDNNNNNQHNGPRKDDEQDPSPGSGAAGGASNLFWPSSSPFNTFGTSSSVGEGGGGYPTTIDFGSDYNNLSAALDFREKRSWKSLAALRLQILPQALAHGISKTPIVLKRIQLQAALALESKGMKQTQAVHVLKREIAMMTYSVAKSSLRIRMPFTGVGAAVTDVLPLIARTMMLPESALQACQSHFPLDVLTRTEESPNFEDTTASLRDTVTDQSSHTELRSTGKLNGKQLYQCIRNPHRSRSWRPSRLIHVGSRGRPTLHLDVSETIPTNAEYCSVSHSWDNGPGILLTNHNFDKLKQSIPAERLSDTMQNAISFARDKGMEYLWIDTLCIIQDSVEDWYCEGPNLDQIYNSASYSIVVTTTVLSDAALKKEERQDDANMNKNAQLPLSLNASVSLDATSIPETPGLTMDFTEGDSADIPSSRSSSEHEDSPKALNLRSQQRRMIKYSPQIMSFLAERDRTPFSLPFTSKRRNDSPDAKNKKTATMGSWLTKWNSRWSRLSKEETSSVDVASSADGVSSAGNIFSQEPSISDTNSLRSSSVSFRSFKIPVTTFLLNFFKKYPKAKRSKHVDYEFLSSDLEKIGLQPP